VSAFSTLPHKKERLFHLNSLLRIIIARKPMINKAANSTQG
jgi:hypothetical protein